MDLLAPQIIPVLHANMDSPACGWVHISTGMDSSARTACWATAVRRGWPTVSVARDGQQDGQATGRTRWKHASAYKNKVIKHHVLRSCQEAHPWTNLRRIWPKSPTRGRNERWQFLAVGAQVLILITGQNSPFSTSWKVAVKYSDACDVPVLTCYVQCCLAVLLWLSFVSW